MRIYTLGTSHGDSTADRFNSSTVYETADGALYLVDAGAPCEALMRRKGLSIVNLKAVFLTHMHDDHTGGLTSVVKQVRKYAGLRPSPLKLFFPEKDAIAPFNAWMNCSHYGVTESEALFEPTEDGEIYDDGILRVSAIRTRHLRINDNPDGEPCSFAYVLDFYKENVRVLHTGDLYGDFSDFPKIALEERFDACLCEATHYFPETAVPVFMKAKIGRLIFTHIPERWSNRVDDAWNVERGEQKLLDYYADLPYKACVAHDGDEFVI